MARDRRFVAAHCGGPLDPARHRLLALWAADCAEHVLPQFTARYPDDDRPRAAIEVARAWSRGEVSAGEARAAAVQAHSAAREACDDAARAAARAAAHAAATAHMADHSLGPVYYGVMAAKLAARGSDSLAAGAREHKWQREHLPEPVRELVVSALDERTVLGRWQP